MYVLFFKPLFDFTFSILLFPFFLLATIFSAPLIYLEDKGSVFYVSKRLGKDGKIFNMLKFRSMGVNAPDIRLKDGSAFNSDNDVRVTKIGKFLRKTSLDEIPQIINVLKGEMSFIGPRPNLPSNENKYSLMEKDRVKIRPGITGLSQCYYRNAASPIEKYQKDMEYIKNASFLLDLKIIAKTIHVVINQKNINKK